MPSDPLSPLPDLFPGIPDSARLWVFGVSRDLDPSEEERFLGAVDRFLASWQAHGSSLAAAREWRHGRFLLVAVDERVAAPSGCSIDALVRILHGLEGELGIEAVGGAPVWYRKGGSEGTLQRVSRAEFREAVARGEVTAKTPVFDLSLTRVEEARSGRWELPAGASWHRRYLEL